MSDHPWLEHYPDGVAWDAPIPTAPLGRLMADAAASYGSRPAWDFPGRRTNDLALRRTARLAA